MYPLKASREEEIQNKKKFCKKATLFSILISGLGIFAAPLYLLGGLCFIISLIAWIYYSNAEYKEVVPPVLYKKNTNDTNAEEDETLASYFLRTGLEGWLFDEDD